MLGEVLEERERARRDAVAEVPWSPATVPHGRFPVIGCLTRLVLFVLVLIALAVSALFVLFGGVLY
jgi:hypothetical protein